MHNKSMKRGKKGQVTLFVVIAIVLVSVVVLLLVLKPEIIRPKMSEEEAKRFLAPQIEELRVFTANCVEKTALNYFERIGMHAGYYKYDGLNAINFSGDKVVVAYKSPGGEFVNALPSLSLIEKGFDIYMQEEGYKMLDECTDNFKSFKKVMGIEEGAREITAECREEDVIVNVVWSITASKADVSLDAKPKDVKLLIPLKTLWSIASDIVNYEADGGIFIGESIDRYVFANDRKLRKARIESELYPTHKEALILLRSIPYRTGEEEYIFNFAINRT